MLARPQRLTSAQEFAAVIRRGRRAGTRTLVVHLVRGGGSPTVSTRVGLVVGKAIGNAVTRNQVKRRLRHLLRERLAALPGGSMLVVRALPPAGSASSAELGTELDSALVRALRDKGAA
jgi:ribonuclease P protein component